MKLNLTKDKPEAMIKNSMSLIRLNTFTYAAGAFLAIALFFAPTQPAINAIVLRGSSSTRSSSARSASQIWHYEDQQAWGGQCTTTAVQQSPLEFNAQDVKPPDY